MLSTNINNLKMQVMKFVQIFTIIILLFCSLFSIAQSDDKFDCKFLRHCTLKYVDDVGDTTAYIIIDNNSNIEYSSSGKYYIKSKLNWLNDCEYNMTMEEITLPNFPFQAGDSMNVKFDNIEKDIIYFTSNVNGLTMKGRFKLIK
ncbi:MAG: hypothetical protein V4556_07455 [Bacteroidota bacterium]